MLIQQARLEAEEFKKKAELEAEQKRRAAELKANLNALKVLCRLTSHPLKVNVTTCTLQRLQMISQA